MASAEGIYRRVSVRTWTDEKVGRLTPLQPSGQALWLYLLTGPHTGPIPGVFVAGRAALAEALNWELEDFDRCSAELMREGLVQFDKGARLWFIPNAVRHNPPASPNVVTGWRTHWVMLPECQMRDRIASQITATLETASKACAEAFQKACGKASQKASGIPLANQEQEQEQEQEAGQGSTAPDGPVQADAFKALQEEASPQEPKAEVFRLGRLLFAKAGRAEKQVGPLIGKLRNAFGDNDEALSRAMRDCEAQQVADPLPWLLAASKQAAHRRGSLKAIAPAAEFEVGARP